MLFIVLIVSCLVKNIVCSGSAKDVKTAKPYAFPVPFELPYRNERAQQCWLRIEDVQFMETISVYCFMAHEFLENYIHDYNSKAMIDDGVDVSLWSEKARTINNLLPPDSSQHSIKDWRVTTILDPTTRMRLYVSTNADCRLIMYTRDATSNYNVTCERILYYFNMRPNGAGSVFSRTNAELLAVSLFLILFLPTYLLKTG